MTKTGKKQKSTEICAKMNNVQKQKFEDITEKKTKLLMCSPTH